MNRQERRAAIRRNKPMRLKATNTEIEVNEGPKTLKELCAARDMNWNALKGKQHHLQRIILKSPQTQEEIEFVMAVMVCAHTELVAREMIEREVDKTMEKVSDMVGDMKQ